MIVETPGKTSALPARTGADRAVAHTLGSAPNRSALVRFVLPFAAVGIPSLALLVSRDILPENTAYLLFAAAVAVSAALGGMTSGLFATLLSAFSSDYFLVGAERSTDLSSWVQLPLSLFILVSLLICTFTEVLHAAQKKAQAAQAEAETERRRLAFLAEASIVLDTSLDYNKTLSTLARLVVPRLADWCAIEVLEEDQAGHEPERPRMVAVASLAPGGEEALVRLQSRYPLDAQGQNPVMRVLATGEPDVYQDIPDEALVAASRDTEHLELLRGLSVRSYLCVPLRARGRTIGAMMFGSAARRRYGRTEITLAMDLARRAALAVDNARLYRAAQKEIAERKRTEEALVASQEETRSLNERLKRSVIETHHRVKNNLQVIAAMVDMLIMDDRQEVPTEAIAGLGSHIRTLAAMHDILTHATREGGEVGAVSSRTVLEKLLPLMEATTPNHRIQYDIQEAPLASRQATSLALLVNELVSNAIKHGREKVHVRFCVADHTARLEVCDDGPGFPPDFDPRKAANTGLELVESLSRWDLGGELRFENRPEGGAQVTVAFPLRMQDDRLSVNPA